MNTDAFAYDTESISKRVPPDAYHPPGLRGMPVVLPAGFLLFAIGIGIAGLIEKDREKARFELMFALAFGSMGLAFGWTCWQALSINKRRLTGSEPALQDFPWDRTKSEVKGSGRFGPSLMWALVMSGFLSFFNVELFNGGLPTGMWSPGQIAIGVFDVLIVAMWVKAGYHWLQERKFGVTRVEFARFPFSTAEPVRLRWVVPRNATAAKSASFKLCCMTEYTEHYTDSQGKSSARIVNEQLWAGTWRLKQPVRWMEGEVIELEWLLPERTQPTLLKSVPAIYWRLDVRVGLPGTDFFAGYLIPVYG